MREASVARKTAETEIRLRLNLDGRGEYQVDTGCGFLNHMLELFARHGRFDLSVKCTGDTDVDDHHTVEDTVSRWGVRSPGALWRREHPVYMPLIWTARRPAAP